jgi:SM-20-related protein
MIDVLNIAGFLSVSECNAVIAEIRESSIRPATVSGAGDGRALDPLVRKAGTANLSHQTEQMITRRVTDLIPRLSDHFEVGLTSVEPPQFLHYRQGDHFVAHQDGNTPVINDETLDRKVSVIVFLNGQCEIANTHSYTGGSLLLHGKYPDWEYRQEAVGGAGTLVAFRSETTHEVTPVEGGERFTIASWLRTA